MFYDDIEPKNFHTRRNRNLNREMTLEQVFLKKYPYRFKRMKRDMKWLRKKMVKHGFNPEDVMDMLL